MKNNYLFLVAIFLFAISGKITAQSIVINEIVTSNTTINTDEDGTYQDWVELYNNGSTAVNLTGYGLSDDAALPMKWIFPAVNMAPGSYLLVWCSSKDRRIVGQPLHTNFKISSTGEPISLSNASGVLIENIPAIDVAQNTSYGHLPNGSGPLSFMGIPSPAAENFATATGEILSAPTFSQLGGYFSAPQNVTLSTTTPGATIIYTVDGSDPDPANLAGTTYSYKNVYAELPGQSTGPLLNNTFQTLSYSAPITVVDRSADANKISAISSTFSHDPTYLPTSPIFKGTVIRAKTIKPGANPSKTVSQTFIISSAGGSRFSIPVVSLSISENKLFDYTDGIYVAGKDFDDWRTANPTADAEYQPVGNYFRRGLPNEREANLTYFVNGQQVLNQNIGIRIHGGTTRAFSSKSLNLYARSTYGAPTLGYKFFSRRPATQFESLTLRNSGGDFEGTMFRDAMNHELVTNLNCATEAYQPAITLINGEFYGILNIREKQDNPYFTRLYNVPNGQLDVISNQGEIEEGDDVDYYALNNYMQTADFTVAANYDYIKTRIDPESFADYYIANIFVDNTDWPGTNVTFWRSKNAYNANAAYGLDGRWRWTFHDMDDTFAVATTNFNHNNLALATAANGPDYPNPAWSTLYLRKMLANPGFKNYFINRFADLLNTNYTSPRVVAKINELKNVIYGVVPEHVARWKSPGSMNAYNSNVQREINFANARPAFQRNHIRNKFGISGNVNATLDVSDIAAGFVHISTIDIKDGTPGIASQPYPWTGIYFAGIAVKIKAVAKPGYVFTNWSGASSATTEEITLNPAANFSLTANFTQVSGPPMIFINEIVSSQTTVNTDEDGTYQDWVELYNGGVGAVNLDGYGLTDDSLLPYKWTFPSVTMAPGSFLLIYCSSKDRRIPGQPLHTNWKISSSGEPITLTAPGNVPMDTVAATVIPENNSYGRFPDGSPNLQIFTAVTPNAPNDPSTPAVVLNAPTLSQPSGFYTADVNLSITAEAGTTIIYTLDGSDPDPNNLSGTTYSYKKSYPQNPGDPVGPLFTNTFTTLAYSAPITITERTAQANKLSMISSTYDLNPNYFPNTNVFKSTVVKARAIKAGSDPSPIVTRNYFVSPAGSSRFGLPVISISLDENKLFDYTAGIYVAGKIFDDYRATYPSEILDYPIGNYQQKGSAFERRANFSYFLNGVEKLNQDVGIRIQGDFSRYYPNKSLNIYSRANFGTDGLAYKFFADRPFTNFQNIAIKTGGSDYYNSLIKEPLASKLLVNLNTTTESSQPAIRFINGEYWGIISIREKYDDAYFNQLFGIPKTEVDLLENDGIQIEEGDNAHYLAMVNYFQNNSLIPQANYDYIQTQMDVDSFKDYYISNIFLDNTDWPGNNVIFWRRNVAYNPAAPYGNDGRWRWASHDMGGTFGVPNHNNLAIATSATGTGWPNPQWSTLQLRKLLENPTFKNDFISRFADLMNTTFLSSRVVGMVDQLKNELSPEMVEQIARWNRPSNLGDWNYYTNNQKNFANQRPNFQRNHIRAQFGIANNLTATLNVSNNAHGYIKINTIEIKEGTDGVVTNPYPWTGVYFSNIPVKLKAIAKPGFVFDHWTGSSTSTDAEITITTNSDFAVTAVFAPAVFAVETAVPVYFWWINGAIPNNLPLLDVSPTYVAANSAKINFQSALAGYPFDAGNANWRKASMERRNKPTPINYRADANGGLPYVANDMKAIQITQPFQNNGLENTMILDLSTVNYKKIKLSFAAMDEGAATGITVDYAVNEGVPSWINTSLATTSLPLVLNTFQLYETDFSSIVAVENNPNFKVRLRFTGPDMTLSLGNRVTFNNIALDGVRLPLVYTSPNVFSVGTTIVNLVPQVSVPVSGYTISPNLPAGLLFDTATGIISGTPLTVTATSTYTVTATNAGGTASFGVVITVGPAAPTMLSYSTPNIFTVGTAIADLTPTITGTVTAYSVSPSLPNGLSLDGNTGVISGTPTSTSVATNYVVTATNSGGSISFDVSIAVINAAPIALSYNTPNTFTVNSSLVNLQPTVSGADLIFTVSPNLPNGLSIDTNTGLISGTPTSVSAATNYVVTGTNSGGSISFDVSIAVINAAPIALSYNTPNVFMVNSSIVNLLPTVSGSDLVFTVSPSLPSGLSIESSTGIISGTPNSVSGDTNYIVTATNSGGSISFDVSIAVINAAPVALSYNTPNVFTLNSSVVNLLPTVSGADLIFTVSPSLPNGLSLDANTGVISGTPTWVSAAAIYTVTATNSGGSISFDVSIAINAASPVGLSYNTPNIFTVNSSIVNLLPTVSGSDLVFTVSPNLPNGLSIDSSTGLISGTPTLVSDATTYNVTATNSGGSISFDVSIAVINAAPVVLSYNTPNVFIVNSSVVNLLPTVSGADLIFTVSPSLPNGLSLDANTGLISGTPTSLSVATTYNVTATNTGGSISFDVSIAVINSAPIALSYNTPNIFTVNSSILNLLPTVSGSDVVFTVSPNLPNGLLIDSSTGLISGTPTSVSVATNYLVTATNSGGSTSFDVSIAVINAAPVVLSYNTPNVFIVNSSVVNLLPTVSGADLIFTVSPSLPNGLSLDANTGLISGTPTSLSVATTYNVTATNTGGSISFDVSIAVINSAPIALSYNTPNIFTVNSSILNLLPTVSGSDVVFTVSPNLPNGLSLDANSGLISGTPTSFSLATNYIVTATNSGGSISFDVSIAVINAAPIGLSYNTPNVFIANSSVVNLQPTVSGADLIFTVSPSLSNGLSLDANTGLISGTPTSVSVAAIYTVTATNSGGSISFDVSIAVINAAPIALSYNTPNVFTVNSSVVNLLPTVSGADLIFTVSPNLPSGLSIDANTGIISGTPTSVSVATNYLVTATNSGGSVSFDVSIAVINAAPIALSYNTPNVFTVNSSVVNLLPTVSGADLIFTVSPSLPSGLSLDANTGVISGTPTSISAAAIYTVTATSSGGNISFDVSIAVINAAPIALSYNTPNVFTVNSSIVNLLPTVSGADLNFTVSPSLPSGLSLDANTGLISGTPTSVSAATNYTVIATNSGGSVSFDVSISVINAAPIALSYNTPNSFIVGASNVNLSPSIFGTVTNYSIQPELPAGLSINPETGVISGVPLAVTTMAAYTVTASNPAGAVTFDIEIEIVDAAPLSLSYSSPNTFVVGTTIANLQPTVSGANMMFSVSPNLPAGLSMDQFIGTISGTPTIASPMTAYTVTATNSGGSVSFDVMIEITPELGVVGQILTGYSIWPNPFTNHINISGIDNGTTYELFTVEGRLIQKGRLINHGVEFNNIANGVYMLKLNSNGKMATTKIIKKD